MRKDFETQKNEVNNLHKKYEEYLNSEYVGRDYSLNLSNPDNFIDGIYYHQANSNKGKETILKKGFDANKVSNRNCGAGRGLYLGRDKNALVNFYSDDLNNPQDFTLKIRGEFNFLDLLDDRKFLQENKYNLEKKFYQWAMTGLDTMIQTQRAKNLFCLITLKF